MSNPSPASPSVGPFALPVVTVDTLLKAGRTLLLDPTLGPWVQPPGQGNERLQDVRIRGDATDGGVAIGTQNWTPGESGWPWGILTAWQKNIAYRETYHGWEDWTAFLHLGLANAPDGVTSLHSWALAWDGELTQWFPFHRRFGLNVAAAGDVWWEYHHADVRPFVDTGVSAFGLICRLQVRNVVPVTWGV